MTSSENTSSVTRFLESTESLAPSENTNNPANKTIIYICGLLLVIVLFIQINYQTSYQASTNNLVYCEGAARLASSALEDLPETGHFEKAILNPEKHFRRFGVGKAKRVVVEKQTNSMIEIENEKVDEEKLVSEKDQFIPQFYVITPTYARVTQKADLTSVQIGLEVIFFGVEL